MKSFHRQNNVQAWIFDKTTTSHRLKRCDCPVLQQITIRCLSSSESCFVLFCFVLSFARGNCASDLHSDKEAHTVPLSRKTVATEVHRLAIQEKNGTDATCHKGQRGERILNPSQTSHNHIRIALVNVALPIEQNRPERKLSDFSESEHILTCVFVLRLSGALSKITPAYHPRGAAGSVRPSNQYSRVTKGSRTWPACERVCHQANKPQATRLGWPHVEQGQVLSQCSQL